MKTIEQIKAAIEKVVQRASFCWKDRKGAVCPKLPTAMQGALRSLCIVATAALAFIGCAKEESLFKEREVKITVYAPTALENPEFVSLKATITKDGKAVECSARDNVITARLLPTQYELEATAAYMVKGRRVEVNHKGGIAVPEGENVAELEIDLVYSPLGENRGIIIQEIFFTGTKDQAGRQYDDDKYIILVNSSLTRPQKLDGLVFARSGFMTNLRYECTPPPDFDNFLLIDLAYEFPSGAAGCTLQPGESAVICQCAVDHTEANDNSIDLGAVAKYEWVTIRDAAKHDSPNDPAIPDLLPLCYIDWMEPDTDDYYWPMNTNGGHGYALIRPQYDEPLGYFMDPKNLYRYTFSWAGVGSTIPGCPYFKIPNEWVVDFVATGIRTDIEWAIVSPLLDAGVACVADEHNSELRYFLSVQRKKDSNGEWQDTNNSTNDFEAKRASLLSK